MFPAINFFSFKRFHNHHFNGKGIKRDRFFTIRSLLLKKYVLYNLCFVLLPTIILVVLYTFNYKVQLIKDFTSSHEYVLTQTMKTVDTNMNNLGVIAIQLRGDARVSPYQLKKGTYATVEAIAQLKLYYSQISFLDDLLIYIKGEDKLYSSKGVTAFSNFSQDIYEFRNGWTGEMLKEMLETGGKYSIPPQNCTIKRKGVNKEYLTVIYPWNNSETTRIGSIMGIVNTRFFQQLLDENRSTVTHSTYIFSYDNHLLFSSNRGVNLSTDETEGLLKDAEAGKAEINMAGVGKCSVIVLKSDINGWKYMTVLPHSQFSGKLFYLNKNVYIFVGFLCAVCIVIGIILAYQTYLPIYNLYIRLCRTEKSDKKRNELAAIDGLISDIVDSNNKLKSKLDENRTYLKQKLLQDIIMGNADPEKVAASAEIKLPHPGFCIMVIKPAGKLTSVEREELLGMTFVPAEYAYAIEMMYKDYIVVLVNIRDDQSHRMQIAEKICEIVAGSYGLRPLLGVGNIYKNVSEVSNSLTEAVIAIENGEGKDCGDIRVYDNIVPYQNGNSVDILQSLLLKLTEWLRQRNRKMVNITLRELHEPVHVKLAEEDMATVRFMTNLIVINLLPVAQDAHVENLDTRVSSLIHYSSVESFFEGVVLLCNEILVNLDEQTREIQANQYERLLDYIEKNYLSLDISLTSIAEMFDMTPSYLSRFFREKTGMNFIDYLSEKRMSEACRLLKYSSMKVKDIMEHVGYMDIASFTRKFKHRIGMSPGKYRDRYKAGDEF